MVSEDKLREIRDRVRLEDLVRDYNVILQQNGSRYKALCPFHNEKTPSFHVNPDYQYFKCFGCGASGDIFSFVQKSESVTFPEAIEILARKASVELDEPGNRAFNRNQRNEKTKLFEALELARDYYHHLLLKDPKGEIARTYLTQRGITPESWKEFQLGYSPDSWSSLCDIAQSRQIKMEILEKAGLARARQNSGSHRTHSQRGGSGHYDYFRNRLMFPILDGLKRVVGFGARALGDDHPKYLNTQKTLVFDKSQILYGLPQARESITKEKTIAVVEGYTDVIMAHQAGLKHLVASLGTAFTQQNAQQLKRLAPQVEMVFDGDSAGQSAAERSLDLLVEEDLDVKIYSVVNGLDPCDAIQQDGAEVFYEKLRRDAVGIFEFKWNRTIGSLKEGRDGASHKAQALDEVLKLLVKLPNPVTRQLQVSDLADKLGISADDVRRRLSFFEKQKERRDPSGQSSEGFGFQSHHGGPDVGERLSVPGHDEGAVSAAPGSGSHSSRSKGPGLEEIVLECILVEPQLALRRFGELPQDFFQEPDCLQISRVISAHLQKIEGQPFQRKSILRDLVGVPEAIQRAVSILERIEEFERAKASDGASSVFFDPEERWKRCLNDVQRQIRLKRRSALDRKKLQARTQGDQQALLNAEKETYNLIREIHDRSESSEETDPQR